MTEMQASDSLNMLSELLQNGKISEETAEIYKTKLVRITDAMTQSYQHHKQGYEKLQELKQNLINEKVKQEQAHNAQNENQLIQQELNQAYNMAKNELLVFKEKDQALEEKFQNLEEEKSVKVAKIEAEQNKAKMAIKPEKDKQKQQIKELNEDKVRLEGFIASEQTANQENNERKSNLLGQSNKLKEEIVTLEEEISKIRDDPGRFEKNAKMLEESCKSLEKGLKENEDIIKEKRRTIVDQEKELDKQKGTFSEMDKHIESEKEKLEDYDTDIGRLTKESNEKKIELATRNDDKVLQYKQLKELHGSCKNKNDKHSLIVKECDHLRKNNKREEHNRYLLKTAINDYQMQKDKIERDKLEYKLEQEKKENMIHLLHEEMKLMVDKYDRFEDTRKEKNSDLTGLRKKIEDYEKLLIELQQIESNAVKTVKNLTTIRETMARKASAALAEVRETREELKIKEQLILDQTKKQQEIEIKLNNFKALYEEVKSARNKYVNLIQNSSQDLAELKERIKIIQSELEILKSESTEKERTLSGVHKTIQNLIHERDKGRAELNKLEYKKKDLIEKGNQQANEIAKLNMIILSLEKDMLEIRKHYERACESRNYMGVQLIDRNDELCILYEKSNIHDNIIRNGETEIKKLEDDIRMIKIEISEVSRKIEVARKKVSDVPKLADEVITLKNELENERLKEQDLSEKLEDPQNTERWREFKGEDPDQEALEAKIQVLEERLNMKKEALLEKELILDEVTNLSENLRKQALEGRFSTQEVSSRVNDLQARLKDITRKMMATISELSMFQANVIKLKQEKEDVVIIFCFIKNSTTNQKKQGIEMSRRSHLPKNARSSS